ncbi:MAG: hydrogenase expression/formation protein HypE [Deltaproteobacteria bacterium]|nr:hydrogenase expression/formation protein HypE [Deltaproteobacteria bacterium]
MNDRPDLTGLLAPSCPAPAAETGRVTLPHGAGAGASARLFETLLWPRLANDLLAPRHDGAVLGAAGGRLAFTTDGFVVSPLVFPGGDIGSLAVHGTLNDLAMCGARPLALSCALILEEGLPLATLAGVVDSLARAAADAGVPVATGDTKVVERGKGDGLFVTTAAVGLVPGARELGPGRVREGDAVLASGPIGCHGAAVLSVREGLHFESEIMSDSAWIGPMVEALLEAVPGTRCLRDPTRGGLGAVLHEIARGAGAELEIDEAAVPVDAPVRAACELLGLDPLFLASEGRCVAFVAEADAERALAALRSHPLGRGAARIGRVRAGAPRVVVRTRMGARRLLVLPEGEPLPRIC